MLERFKLLLCRIGCHKWRVFASENKAALECRVRNAVHNKHLGIVSGVEYVTNRVCLRCFKLELGIEKFEERIWKDELFLKEVLENVNRKASE
jgi:hypothetical protein